MAKFQLFGTDPIIVWSPPLKKNFSSILVQNIEWEHTKFLTSISKLYNSRGEKPIYSIFSSRFYFLALNAAKNVCFCVGSKNAIKKYMFFRSRYLKYAYV